MQVLDADVPAIGLLQRLDEGGQFHLAALLVEADVERLIEIVLG